MANVFTSIARTPDLRNRILFTLGLLGVYRLGVFVPCPGVDREALGDFFANNEGTLFGLYDMFSGGALEQFSVFMLGIMPYISASILMQMMVVVVPQLERINKEGQTGRNKVIQYTRYMAIAISIVQALASAFTFERMKTSAGADIVIHAGLAFRLMTVLTMTAGACFVMWLGEQISDRGIGNGSSILITANIIARLPSAVMNTFQKVKIGDMNLLGLVLLLAGMALVVAFIVFVERAQRRVPIQYAKRVVGRRIYGGQATHLPLKINTSGVIPPIFASSVMMFPGTIASFYNHPALVSVASAFTPGRWLYFVTFLVLIVFFAYFYTAITFNPVDVADNLRRQGGYVPGIRPGRQTADFIDYLLTRLTAVGAVYLSAVCILPTLLIQRYGVPFYFGGTSLIIVVGVTLDTVGQIEAHLLTRHYDGVTQSGGSLLGRVRQRRRMLTAPEEK
ncbi:MAG: preprotein translocase subunit SecY [Deltaproteobacteria bacterium]|nr:preprotein translocase subunit SecY [Deltaproteobacteria bacterium]